MKNDQKVVFKVNRSPRQWSLVVLWLLAAACGREAAPVAPPATVSAPAADPLPSWNQGVAKQSIVDVVGRVTRQGGPDFVPPPERIATFDNDGTLWSEKRAPFQLIFAVDQVKALAPQHPEWKAREPFAFSGPDTQTSESSDQNGQRVRDCRARSDGDYRRGQRTKSRSAGAGPTRNRNPLANEHAARGADDPPAAARTDRRR